MLIRAGAETSKGVISKIPTEHACEEVRIFFLVGISAFSHFSDLSSILVNQEPG